MDAELTWLQVYAAVVAQRIPPAREDRSKGTKFAQVTNELNARRTSAPDITVTFVSLCLRKARGKWSRES